MIEYRGGISLDVGKALSTFNFVPWQRVRSESRTWLKATHRQD